MTPESEGIWDPRDLTLGSKSSPPLCGEFHGKAEDRATSASGIQNMKMAPPSAYTKGQRKARLFDRALADRYVEHTRLGDPVLDPVMREVSALPPAELHRFIEAGIEEQNCVLLAAPQALRDFFQNMGTPAWLDRTAFAPGIRAFHANADLFLIAFVCGVLVEGFSTLIAKSFYMTGRMTNTHRRLKQNNRHLLEIFLPDGLQRCGEGWKLSLRIRFVHAQVRYLLSNSGEWNSDAWGTPISAAHLGYAISAFSVRLLQYARKVGAAYSEEERKSFIAVWRYAGFVMGVPESILYRNEEEANNLYRIGRLCEPLADSDSVAMANELISSAPKIADITDPKEQHSTISLAYRLSRALIGNQLADQLEYPKKFTFGVLVYYRMMQRAKRLIKSEHLIRSHNLSQLIQLSAYDDNGLSYRLPDHVKDELSSKW